MAKYVSQNSFSPNKNNITILNLNENQNKENIKIDQKLYVKPHEEYQYLSKIEEIFKHGHTRIDRTNIGTKSIFGTQSRYSLRNGLNLFLK